MSEQQREKDLVVVKYGSTSVTNKHGMDMDRLDGYADRIARLHARYDVIVVSSGSVKTGEAIWRRHHVSDPVEGSDQPYAMLGSARAVTAWQEVLEKRQIEAGQLLVTHKEIDTEGDELRSALQQSLDHGIITIVNENDAISQIELAKRVYGADNDGMAAHITQLMGAQAMFLMTDQRGVLRRDGSVVHKVEATEQSWQKVKTYANDGERETNGMVSKMNACIEVARVGIDAYIGGASIPFGAMMRRTNPEGTHFIALNQAA